MVLTHSASYTDVGNLYTALINGHNRYLRPSTDLTIPTAVSCELSLVSIMEVNGMEGSVSISGYFTISWTDEILTWAPATYGNANEITLPHDVIWKPPLIVTNSAQTYSLLGTTMKDLVVNLNYDGSTLWQPGEFVQFACSIDTTYFPFDQQKCDIKLLVWGYKDTEVALSVSPGSKIDTSSFSENSEWDLVETSHTSISSNYAQYSLTLKRRPAYFIINILLPVVFIAFLNIFVFILPQESGERLGFAITSLLSIVVFLTIAQGLLPATANPRLSGICMLLVVDMFMSGAITVSVIFSSWLYHRSEDKNIPGVILKVLNCKKRKIEDNCRAIDVKGNNTDLFESESKSNVTWQDVSRMFDTVSLVFYILWLIISLVAFAIDITTGVLSS